MKRIIAEMQGLPLLTSRLRVRPFVAEDAEDYHDIFRHESVCRFDDFTPIDLAQSRADMAELIGRFGTDHPEREYAVERIEDGRVIGALCVLREPKGFFIGFHFNPEFQGRGYARESAEAFVAWLEEVGRVPVMAVVDPENIPSIALLERLGLQRQGTRPTQDGIEYIYTRPALKPEDRDAVARCV